MKLLLNSLSWSLLGGKGHKSVFLNTDSAFFPSRLVYLQLMNVLPSGKRRFLAKGFIETLVPCIDVIPELKGAPLINPGREIKEMDI